MKKLETKQTGLRVPLSLYPQIVAAAKRDGRTINAQLLQYVLKAMQLEQQSNHPTQDNHSSFGS